MLTTVLFFRDLGVVEQRRERVRRARRRCSCGSPCCSPTSPRRWPRGAARRRPTRCARPAPRRSRDRRRADGIDRGGARHRSSTSATLCVVVGRRGDPGRRRRRRGHRHRRRVGDHRRVGAGDPRVRRRPLGGHRRHPGAVRPRSSCASPPSPGETFLDRMIALVEGAERQKTPNEIALNILLAGLTIIFLLADVTLQPFAIYSDAEQPVIVLVALLVCLIPTTIGGLLSAIGIAGMDRLVQRNVLAMSGRAVEAAGDVHDAAARQDRHDHVRQPAGGRVPPGRRRRRAASSPTPRCSSSLADETPEGRSIVVLAERALRPRAERELAGAELVPFTAQTRMSGIDYRRSQRPQGRGRLGAPLGRGAGRHRPARARRRSSTAIAGAGRHAARRRRAEAGDRRAGARRDPPQGHRQAGHARALRRAAARWASAP